MLNAMSQGRRARCATLHAASSRGVFTQPAVYAVRGPGAAAVEATNLLISGALHFVVQLDSEMHDADAGADFRTDPWAGAEPTGTTSAPVESFPPRRAHARFVSSVREVIDAEGVPGDLQRGLPTGSRSPGDPGVAASGRDS